MSDKIQEAMLEQLVKLTESVQGLAHGQKRLDDKVSSLDDKVSSLDHKVSQVEENVSSLGKRLDQVDEKVTRVEETVVRIENEHGEKLGVLFDAFSLRGDQIDQLKEHMDLRLDSLQTSINFLIHRTNEHDNELMRLRKVR